MSRPQVILGNFLHFFTEFIQRDCVMKKFLLATVFSATFALLAACGDDVTEVT